MRKVRTKRLPPDTVQLAPQSRALLRALANQHHLSETMIVGIALAVFSTAMRNHGDQPQRDSNKNLISQPSRRGPQSVGSIAQTLVNSIRNH